MSIKNNIFRKIFSVFLALLIVVTSVYFEAADSYADDIVPYKWTRVKSDEELKSMLIKLSGKNEDELDKNVEINNKNDYHARILIVSQTSDNTFVYLSSNETNALGEGPYCYTFGDGINGVKLLNPIYGSLDDGYFYSDTGLDSPYIKLSQMGKKENSGLTVDFNPENETVYTLRRCNGETLDGDVPFIGTTYYKTIFSPRFCANDNSLTDFVEWETDNPYSIFDFDDVSGTARLKYRLYATNTLTRYFLTRENAVTSYIYFSESTKEYMTTEQLNEAGLFYIFVGTPTTDTEYFDYKYEIQENEKKETDDNSKTNETEDSGKTEMFAYKWTKIKTAESFEETLLDIVSAAVGSEVYNTNKNINNIKDYNARLMIVSAGNNMLFGNGQLSVQKAAAEIDVGQDKFYTLGTNYGLPFTKLVENSRGETVDYFSIRLANGEDPAEGSNSFIGVELAGKEYKAAYKSAEDVLNGISENSFTLSFYDASSEKVHIQANIAGLGTNRYMTASTNKGIAFVNSTNLIGTDEGTFYVFLGQALTKKEYEDDISGANEKKTPTYIDTTYWKWTKVTSTAELNAAIVDRCSTDTKVKTTIDQLNQNIADLEDYTARILIVPKIKGDQYVPGWEGNADASVNLRSFEDAGIQQNSDGTLESEDDLNAPYIKVVKQFTNELYYGPSDASGKWDNDLFKLVCNPIGNTATEGISYAIRMTGEDGSPKAINKKQSAFLNAWFQIRFGRKADGSWENEDGHSYTIYTWGNAGYFKDVAGYKTSYGWGDLNWYEETPYDDDDAKMSFKYDLAYNPALIDFDGSGSAKIHWRTGFHYLHWLELYNYNAKEGHYGSYKLTYINRTTLNLSIYGFANNGYLYEDVFLRCLADGSAVNGVRENQTFHFTYNLEPYANISSQGDTVLFDLYIGEETVRSSYSGVVGGIDAEFEDTLILENSIAIPSGKTLTVNEGSTLIINGDVYNWGSIKLNGGTLIVNGCLRCIDAASEDASGFKILADKGAQIVVMPGGSIYCYAKTSRAQNNATSDYARILLSNNSSLSTYGLVLCNIIAARKSSSITVEHGGILVTNRYRKSQDQQVLDDFREVSSNSLGTIFTNTNFRNSENLSGLQLSLFSSVKVYGTLFIPKGYSADNTCTLPSSSQYVKNWENKLDACMINW